MSSQVALRGAVKGVVCLVPERNSAVERRGHRDRHGGRLVEPVHLVIGTAKNGTPRHIRCNKFELEIKWCLATQHATTQIGGGATGDGVQRGTVAIPVHAPYDNDPDQQ